MKRILFLLFFCGIIAPGFAQSSPDDSFVLFLHGGYGHLTGKAPGLTNASDTYDKTMSSGVSWNAQMYYKHKKLIAGLLYSSYLSNGKREECSDHILTTYIAPQVGLNIPVGKQFDIALNGGTGTICYLNNSFVYGKVRKVTGLNIGYDLGLKGICNLSDRFGISLEMLFIGTDDFNKVKVKYHHEVFDVKYRSDDSRNLNQFTISLGLKYSL